MDNVEITWASGFIPWDQIPTSNVPFLDKTGFYNVSIARRNPTTEKWENYRLLYIGQAFGQTLRERIPQSHQAYACVQSQLKANAGLEGIGIVVMVGMISKTNLQTITQSLMDDVECCLVNSNKPFCNDKCKDEYSGRDLDVTNAGDFSPLKQTSHCKPDTT